MPNNIIDNNNLDMRAEADLGQNFNDLIENAINHNDNNDHFNEIDIEEMRNIAQNFRKKKLDAGPRLQNPMYDEQRDFNFFYIYGNLSLKSIVNRIKNYAVIESDNHYVILVDTISNVSTKEDLDLLTKLYKYVTTLQNVDIIFHYNYIKLIQDKLLNKIENQFLLSAIDLLCDALSKNIIKFCVQSNDVLITTGGLTLSWIQKYNLKLEEDSINKFFYKTTIDNIDRLYSSNLLQCLLNGESPLKILSEDNILSYTQIYHDPTALESIFFKEWRQYGGSSTVMEKFINTNVSDTIFKISKNHIYYCYDN